MGDKWEYKIVKFEMPSDWPMGKLLYDDLKVKHADCMNELGQEGWEYIMALGPLFYFKRNKEYENLVMKLMNM